MGQVASLAILSDDEHHSISVVLRQYLQDVLFLAEFPQKLDFLDELFLFDRVIQNYFRIAFENQRSQVFVLRSGC